MNNNYYVAIMAGGIGSRFWPISRSGKPKQFLDILNTGKSLLQSTFERYKCFIPTENIFVITFAEYGDLVHEHLPLLPKENILKEPSRKNTAPCVAYMGFKLLQKNPDACFIVAPSDHLVHDLDAFSAISLKALDFAERHNALVTLGITPTYPNTGYGYIQHEEEEIEPRIFKVKTFTEKPNLEIAKSFIASGDFLWNAGIFAWKASVIVEAFEKYLPEMYEAFVQEMELFNTPEEQEALEMIYPQCTMLSIDYGIMEKAENTYIIPASIGWSDLGTWNSAYEQMDKDYLENSVVGNNVVVIDATRNMVHVPHNKLVVLQNLDNYVVVDTEDVLLICKKDKEQEIKDYMNEIKRSKGDKFL